MHLTKEQKGTLARIIFTAAAFAALLICERSGVTDALPAAVLPVIYLFLYAWAGWDIVLKALKNIVHGKVFDENFLMTVATVAAFLIGEYTEAVAVMLFYQVGEWFQDYAVDKSRRSISDLMDICPEYANIERDGSIVRVAPAEIEVGSIIIIKPGERVPLDGTVVEGESYLDTSALTGESVPRRAASGDTVVSGCVNGSGTLKARVTSEFKNSTVSKVLELVENASSKKAETENFITRFAKYYTPAVTFCALALAVIPPLFTGGWFEWIRRACIFLVISCPCAFVLSVPLGFFCGIGAASKIGVLVKGSNYLEAASEMACVVFDKTGTLTKGVFKVRKVCPSGCSEDELLELAALGEGFSDHPIAGSIREACGRKVDTRRVSDVKETAGHGIRAVIDGHSVLIGNEKLMRESGVSCEAGSDAVTTVFVARDGEYLGSIEIADEVKDEAKDAIANMRKEGVKRCVMLTGDSEAAARNAASSLGIDSYYAQLLPGDKVSIMERILSEKKPGERVAFAGDGINDAPVLARADIGIAMGSMGSDAAIEAADIVLMDDNVGKIAKLLGIARKTMRIVRENIIFALAVKAVFLLFGAFGIATMWEAVFADVGVAVLAVLNSMRAFK